MSLRKTLDKSPEDLLIPNEKLKKDALNLIKSHIDPIVKDYSIFDQIHVEGLDADQVWGQVQMVVDGAIEKLMNNEMSAYLRLNSGGNDGEESMDNSEEGENEDDEEDQALENDEEESESFDEYDEQIEQSDSDTNLSVDENQNSDMDIDEPSDRESKPSELDDEIFKLKDFQKQVLALENDDDDGDDIDYGASYFGEEDEEEEDDADARYEDFFAPPKKTRKTKDKNVRFNEKIEQNDEGENEQSIDDNIEELMSSTKRNLFADEGDDDNEQENLSTFERQQRDIMKQIQQYEQENVGEKKWEVRGEVKASDRPADSLIDSELEFDRNTKAAPVITQETTDSLEDIIRRRIKAKDFDDLPRRMPDLLPEFKPSKTVEVQETKSSKSLAELYEEDYNKKNNADTYKDAESEKLNGEHQEIERLFNDLSSKLDSLSSWNYTPKRPEPSISIVSEASAISMEEAQPTAMSTESRLAPQELYKTVVDGKREILGRDGVPVSKREMDRDDRKRQRRKQKAQKAKTLKARDLKRQASEQKHGSKANVISTLKKGNVTIIGKNGEKRDVSGKIKKDFVKPKSSNLKL